MVTATIYPLVSRIARDKGVGPNNSPDWIIVLLDRRTLLQGAAVAVSATVVAQPGAAVALPEKSASPSDQFPTVRVNETTVRLMQVFDETWSTSYMGAFPMDIALDPANESILRLNWDQRLFAVSGSAVLTVRGQLVTTVAVDSGEGHLTIRLPLGTERVFVPTRIINPYPNEAIGAPARAEVIVTGPNGENPSQVTFDAESVTAGAWSVEAYVDWASVSGSVVPVGCLL